MQNKTCNTAPQVWCQARLLLRSQLWATRHAQQAQQARPRSPQRVPIIRPSSGVRPMVVSTLRPFCAAGIHKAAAARWCQAVRERQIGSPWFVSTLRPLCKGAVVSSDPWRRPRQRQGVAARRGATCQRRFERQRCSGNSQRLRQHASGTHKPCIPPAATRSPPLALTAHMLLPAPRWQMTRLHSLSGLPSIRAA